MIKTPALTSLIFLLLTTTANAQEKVEAGPTPGSQFELSTANGLFTVKVFEEGARFRLTGPGFRISVKIPSVEEPVTIEPVDGKIKIVAGKWSMTSANFTVDDGNGKDILYAGFNNSAEAKKEAVLEIEDGIKPEPATE